MKMLLLGKNGQLGWELQRSLAPLGELSSVGRSDGADLDDPQALTHLVRNLRPDVIVNAAAHTAVDRAESEPELAHRINALAPELLAREAAALGALLLHFSTDYVFDGSGTHARDERAATAPINVYGRSKLDGEEGIRASGCRHLIFRTSWVYAARGGNFAKTMLRLASERDRLRVIDDQTGAPTGADLLADLSAHALRVVAQRPDLGGTYHATAAGSTTWHGYARFVIDWARSHGHPIVVAPDAIEAVESVDFPTPARRPMNSRLDCTRLLHNFGLSLPRWQDGVRRMLTEVLTP